ncbi:MarR family transcriptional regulator [Fictibacillus phosphorivorans]|uniref:MarR family transcriptional regulator n=1 Tax=Fictibacillus phosphorivorans TaxID=1221500 RepID=A0A168CQZ1_9BACL|nr:helix-turn-helix domain-containing protein [Fictibacillus phosphorivorans]KZE63892.1 MarR family transcriptional regulator [Fictibacillus phosphorivorans]
MRKNYIHPVEITLDVVCGKWKGVILWHLQQENILRFGELKKLLPGVSQKTLTLQLRELEEDGLVKRKVYPQVPPKVEYSLTHYGQELEATLNQMCEWGKRHKDKVGQNNQPVSQENS